jgi:hypothetical protein
MADRTYWAQVFTPETWQRFLDYGARTTGFRGGRWGHVQKLRPGDYLLCYLSGISKWVGILEVKADPYLDTTPIWDDDLFPCRADVKVMSALPVELAIPIKNMRHELSIFKVTNWSLYLIGSPFKWKASDGEVVLKAVLEAQSKIQKEVK